MSAGCSHIFLLFSPFKSVNFSNLCFLVFLHTQLRPPQPAVYLFVLDVSHNAVEAGYLKYFCESLLENLDKSVMFYLMLILAVVK